MNRHTIVRWVSGFALASLAASTAQAKITPNALFSDNTVLQQKEKVPVWGTTDQPGEVTVAIAGKTAKATPANGKWRADIEPLAAGGPHEMTISQPGSDEIKLKNVLVGEVWICGGQSNMQWTLKQSEGGSEAITNSANDKLRLFTVPRERSDEPRSEVKGAWAAASPQTVGDFSGVGYFFGRDLQKAINVPVGLIASNVGGTAAEEWMSKKAIDDNAEIKDVIKTRGATTLYNAMIAPLAPYAIQGAIWYQGESNAGRAYQYRTLLPAMIKNWQATFEQPDFPFLIVQIAPYEAIVREPSDSIWAEIRDAQLHVSKNVKNTALVVTTDVGDEKDIHPRKKEPVGQRLALAAETLAYGMPIESSGPQYKAKEINGNQVILSFDHVGTGLVAKNDPPGDSLTGFTIAGEDKKFYAANAKVVGNTVVVSSEQVAAPKEVRYGWAAYPVVNLWNKEGLPASPFRTDSFPITTQDKK